MAWAPDQRLSWMAAVLPYLPGGEYKGVPLKTDKSWNENENLLIAQTVVPAFVARPKPTTPYRATYPMCVEKFGATHFVGVAGLGLDAASYDPADKKVAAKLGVFGYDRVTKLSDITFPEQTIVLLQVPDDQKAPWLAGGGSTVRGISEDADCLTPFLCVEREGQKGTYAVMADGKVRFIPAGIDKATFRSMCCIKQDKKIELLDHVAAPVEREAADEPGAVVPPPAPGPKEEQPKEPVKENPAPPKEPVKESPPKEPLK